MNKTSQDANPSTNQTGSQTTPHKAAPLYNKMLFCWLALLTGAIGGHWIYVGQKRFLVHLSLLPIAPFMGWIDCMRFGLMKDEEFNTRFNPSHPANTAQTNGLVVTSVALGLGAFTTAFMTLLAFIFQWYFSGQIS